jgi:hypothetical protein
MQNDLTPTPENSKGENFKKTDGQVWSRSFLNEKKMLKLPALAAKEQMARGVKMFFFY